MVVADRMPDFSRLRDRHPRLIYRSFEHRVDGEWLDIAFDFHLEPDVDFRPTVRIPYDPSVDESALDHLVFHVGLIESISYWKAACPPEVVVECGALDDRQTAWWSALFRDGLGEFFHRNGIPPHLPDLLRITSRGPDRSRPAAPRATQGDLLLVGGGKDSAVMLELARDAGRRQTVLMLNPIPAAVRVAEAAGFDSLQLQRMIDPTLLKLNAAGYLNGHTPFSAYLAFLATMVAFVHGFENVIVGNERSSSQGNVTVDGFVVNHQYSKSFGFEQAFRDYAARHLTTDVSYFSLLRPLWALQVSRMFARYPRHHSIFRSCNVGHRTDSWCGACAKCASVYLSLFPFLEHSEAVAAFGSDFFLHASLKDHWWELTGLTGVKPFDCVATFEESRVAALLSLDTYRRAGLEAPGILHRLVEEVEEVEAAGAGPGDASATLEDWGDHCMPPHYEQLVRNAAHEGDTRAGA